MIKYIFVDLDETLIHAELLYNSPPKDSKVLKFGEYDNYYARLRPGALKLLYELRKIGPTYILTAATREYALGWNDQFQLGFGDVYSREDTSGGLKLNLPPGQCYLIDDLPERNLKTQTKINFIKDIGPVKFIQIKQFTGHSNQALDDSKILEIVSQIV